MFGAPILQVCHKWRLTMDAQRQQSDLDRHGNGGWRLARVVPSLHLFGEVMIHSRIENETINGADPVGVARLLPQSCLSLDVLTTLDGWDGGDGESGGVLQKAKTGQNLQCVPLAHDRSATARKWPR